MCLRAAVTATLPPLSTMTLAQPCGLRSPTCTNPRIAFASAILAGSVVVVGASAIVVAPCVTVRICAALITPFVDGLFPIRPRTIVVSRDGG